MEPILKQSGTSKGLEVMYFEDAEVQKSKGGQSSFAASGPLSVLYFKDYNRFFLRLGGWLYPLMRRLPVSGMDHIDATSSRSYCLPASNGFCFNLRINSYGSDACFENFETILQECSKFSWKGESYHGHLEKSPDDKLQRHLKQESGMKEVITEGLKHGIQTIKTKVETLKTGTKNINSRKKMIDIKTIRNKNFRKNAKSTFKKDFFQSGEKLSKEFLSLRKSNLNMTMGRSYNDLLKTSDSQVPTLYIPSLELEEAILNYRDIAKAGNFDLTSLSGPKTSVSQSIRQGMQDIKDTISGSDRRRENVGENRSRNVNPNPLPGQTNLGQIPTHEHYQG